MQSCSWSTSSPRAIGLPEQDLVGYVVKTHHMTCQTKTSLSHDSGDSWKGAVLFLVGQVIARLELSAELLCKCLAEHVLLFVLTTMNRINISRSVRPAS